MSELLVGHLVIPTMTDEAHLHVESLGKKEPLHVITQLRDPASGVIAIAGCLILGEDEPYIAYSGSFTTTSFHAVKERLSLSLMLAMANRGNKQLAMGIRKAYDSLPVEITLIPEID